MKRIACPIQTILALAGLLLAAPSAGAQSLFTLGETAYLDFAGTLPGASYYAPGDDETYLQVSIGSRRLRVLRGNEVLHEFPVAVGKSAYLRHRNTESGGWAVRRSIPSGMRRTGISWRKAAPFRPPTAPSGTSPGRWGSMRCIWATG